MNDAASQQAALYGAPLGDTVREVTTTLGISQATVARTLGLSPSMLSQLVSGQRIKMGNPRAVQRLQSLLRLADDVRSGLAHDQVAPRLEAIGDERPSTLTLARETAAAAPDVAELFSRLLRAAASGREIAAAVATLEAAGHHDVADVLRAYGTGDLDAARRHHAAVAHLLGP